MKTIAYICNYKENISVNEEISIQNADIKKYCDLHGINIDEIYTETGNSEDVKPVLINIMSTYFNIADKLIITDKNAISKNEDYRDWVLEEFSRMKIEVICINNNTENTVRHEKKLSSITDNIKNIPSLPEIITKSIELMQNPNTSAETLAKLISNDVGLTARVLKLVNSVYYGFPKQISTIQHAIIILGFTTIKGIILSASIYKMFSQKGNTTFNYKNFWKHSMLVATASRLITECTDMYHFDDIFAAAFLHDIGKIIFAQYDWENYSNVIKQNTLDDFDEMKEEEKYCGLNHCEIANMVAYAWNLPEIFCDIITYHHNPYGSNKFRQESSIVYVANKIAQSIESNENLNIDNITLDLLEKFNISVDNVYGIHEKLSIVAVDMNDIDSFFE